MYKRYFSQSFKRQCEDILTLLLVAWVYLNVLISIEFVAVLYCFSWPVMVPAIAIGLMILLLPLGMEVYNKLIGKTVYEDMKKEFARATFKLNKEEKNKMNAVLSDKSVLKKVLEALSSGHRGIVVAKKTSQKARPLKSTGNEKQPSKQQSAQESSFMTMIDERLPRKVIIAFRDGDKPDSTAGKREERNGYSSLAIDLHIIHKSKTGGKKEKFSATKVAVGAFTVCDYTQCISSTGLWKNMVALRERGEFEDSQGVLHRYRFEENKGEAFSRRLYRANERACEPLDKDMVISMMKQVAKQVEERLHRKGKAHMDLKVDNVTISEDGKEFTVIDYPDEQELSGKKSPRATPVVGQLSHRHLLVETVAKQNIYVYADSGKSVERECSICDRERNSFTHMVSSFGHQALRETKYLPIGVDTIFNDTWAALYMAFVAFGAVEDEMEQTICQAKVFSLMKKMFADYISVYLRIHLETIGKGEGFEARLKKEMNQRWPLGRAVKELELEVSVIKDQDKAFMQGLTK